MDCIRCGEGGAFNRVVLNQLTSHELGALCGACEAAQFGELLDDPTWHQPHGCAFCDDSGTYALPPVECLIERADGSPRVVEYVVADDTARLCERHLQALVGTDRSATISLEA